MGVVKVPRAATVILPAVIHTFKLIKALLRGRKAFMMRRAILLDWHSLCSHFTNLHHLPVISFS